MIAVFRAADLEPVSVKSESNAFAHVHHAPSLFGDAGFI